MSGSCLANKNNNGFNLICLPTKGLKYCTGNISRIWHLDALNTQVRRLHSEDSASICMKQSLGTFCCYCFRSFSCMGREDTHSSKGLLIWFRRNILDYSNSLYISIYWDTEELIWRKQRYTPGFFLKSYKICSKLTWILILDLSFSSYKTFSKLSSLSFI